MKKSARAAEIVGLLGVVYPEAECELDFGTPWQLLAATVLSAQCTDVRVNQVTPELFRRWPDARAMAEAPLDEIEEVIRSTGFFRNKALALRDGARLLMADFGGKVPEDLESLLALPGVGRKTAKVVLGVAFGIAAGITVDTHVKRLARRFGLTLETDPERVAADLEALVPRADWISFSLRVILHGRRVCSAGRPDCPNCDLEAVCARSGV